MEDCRHGQIFDGGDFEAVPGGEGNVMDWAGFLRGGLVEKVSYVGLQCALSLFLRSSLGMILSYEEEIFTI